MYECDYVILLDKCKYDLFKSIILKYETNLECFLANLIRYYNSNVTINYIMYYSIDKENNKGFYSNSKNKTSSNSKLIVRNVVNGSEFGSKRLKSLTDVCKVYVVGVLDENQYNLFNSIALKYETNLEDLLNDIAHRGINHFVDNHNKNEINTNLPDDF